jgi:CHASE3 domain sensor protein
MQSCAATADYYQAQGNDAAARKWDTRARDLYSVIINYLDEIADRAERATSQRVAHAYHRLFNRITDTMMQGT